MILSAGLTPAWQQILVFDAFRYGEVNRASEVLWCASGKVFNAGIAAHHLGGPSRTLALSVAKPPSRGPRATLGVALAVGFGSPPFADDRADYLGLAAPLTFFQRVFQTRFLPLRFRDLRLTFLREASSM